MDNQENTENRLDDKNEEKKNFQATSGDIICKRCDDGIIPADDWKCNKCGKSPSGGRRPNSGREPGSMSPVKYEQLKIREAFNQNVMRAATKLFNAQFGLAVGEQSLYVKKSIRGKIVIELVEDEETIKEFLVDDGVSINAENRSHYYLATKPANNMAIDSLLNRALGKAPDKLIVEGGFFKAEKMLIEVVQPNNEISEGEIIDNGTNTSEHPVEHKIIT